MKKSRENRGTKAINEAKLQMQMLKAHQNAAIMPRINTLPIPRQTEFQNVSHDNFMKASRHDHENQSIPHLRDHITERQQMYASSRLLQEQMQREVIHKTAQIVETQRNISTSHRLYQQKTTFFSDQISQYS
jgi:hypothetical protein